MNVPVFEPAGPGAAQIATLGWLLIVVCGAVYVAVLAATAWALWRRRSDADLSAARTTTLTRTVGVATAATTLILLGLVAASMFFDRVMAVPLTKDSITVVVTGHQWWWDFQYRDPLPSGYVSSPNELHVPVGVPVVLVAQSRDVIHSFWVPALHGKRDLIPGQTSQMTILADRAGVYRGQCGEFCGLQHSKMTFVVIAEPRAAFERWIQTQRGAAAEPAELRQQQGRDAFLQSTCVLCHTVRGTGAGGRVGPDLTHVGSRRQIGAGALPNTRQNLLRWIRDPQAVKPGNRMPAHALADDDLDAIATYMESLR